MSDIKSFFFLLCSEISKLGSTDSLSPSQPEKVPMYPPTSGYLMAEKMRLGRQDQGDNDSCEILIFKLFQAVDGNC